MKTSAILCIALVLTTSVVFAQPKKAMDSKNMVDSKEIIPPPNVPCESFLKNFYVQATAGGQERERAVESASTFAVFDPGFFFGGGIGYMGPKVGPGQFRFEVEGNYQYNQVRRLSATGVGEYPGRGHIDLRSGFLDAFYDLHIHHSRWIPYIGGGVGLVSSRINGMWFASGPAAGLTSLYGDATAVAWNVQAGVTYKIDKHFDIFAQYRYQDSGRLNFHFNNAIVPTAGPNGALTHGGELGVRYHF